MQAFYVTITAGRKKKTPVQICSNKQIEKGTIIVTIIVTGGTGFIGGNFIHYHLKAHSEDRVICIDRLTYAGNLSTLASVMDDSNFRFVRLDICDRDGVFKLFEEEKPDAVINFATESHVDRSIENPGIFLETNIIGTSTMMDACRAFGNVRYHQVSTDEVYCDLPLDRPRLALCGRSLQSYRPDRPQRKDRRSV